MTKPNTTHTDSHTLRRIKFGTSVTVAVLAAVGLTILVNWIAARQYLRLDLTRGGSYSLSDQTETVLAKLEGDYRLVTLLPDEASISDEDTAMAHRHVRDLVNEYGRYADSVAVEHLDPRSDITKAANLNNAIAKTFEDELVPVIEAIEQGRSALDAVVPINTKLNAVLTSGVNNDPNTPETPAQQFFRAAATRCTQFDQSAEQAGQQMDERMDQVLVNYAGIKESLQAVLLDYDALLGVLIQSSAGLNRSTEIDDADKERLLEAVELAKQAQALLVEPLQQMDAAEDAPKFHQVLYGLTGSASVVVLGPEQVKVLPVSEMWRQDLRDYEETGQAQPQYLIEEKLTGALLSMTIEQPPLIVFVLSGTGSALGPRGQYNIVAQRLANADFPVTQWSPTGQVSAMGQPTPPLPRPEAEPGQKTVWIVLPTSGQATNPMMMAANPRQQIAELLEERLAAGDAAMVMVAADPSATYGLANPINDYLAGWGINVLTDRLILSEVQQANRRSETSIQFVIDTWSEALPITTALNGMQALFQITSPINISTEQGATHHTLVEVTGDKLWTHTDLSSPQAVQGATYDESTSAESFTIATASEKDGKRLITIAEQVWASDDMTGMGLLGPGTAELTGAAVPGNSELFVNSVLWLADLEDLIAASPRSQDVPRIQPMTAGAYWWHQLLLLAGLPLASLVLGLGVWWRRRQA